MIQRRGTAAEWTAANPVLAAGEIGFETDTSKFKFGDGSTAWGDITYFASADALIDGAPDLLDTLNELAAAIGDDEDFIGTITTGLDGKLDLTGGTLTGNLIVSGADASFGGAVNLSGDPVNPTEAATKSYVDAKNTLLEADVNTIQFDVETLQSTVTVNAGNIQELQSDASIFRPIFVTTNQPTTSDNNDEDLLDGTLWYDRSNGQLFSLVVLDIDTTSIAWVEVGGPSQLVDGVYGNNNHDFPYSPAPSDNDTHNGYIYNSDRNAWQIDRSTELNDNTDVFLNSVSDNQVLMYNAANSRFENTDGIALDVDGDIPATFLNKGSSLVVGNATEDFDTLEDIESYLTSTIFTTVPQLTIKSAADWGTDSSTPISGSLNVETGGAEIRVKIGNGTDTYANLDYIPSNAGITSEIASAISPLAPKASPTFTGTVVLPADTSIDTLSGTEISYLHGASSNIQGQLDSLDTLKAPLADPTFTGTVSGISQTMVGLSNVDNTADTDKPVSTAQQTALDAKLDLAGGTLTGNLLLNGDPTQALGAVTKQYADSISEGLHIHEAAEALSDSNIDLTGGTFGGTIDGVTLADTNRVIVNGQTSAAENGIYVFNATGSTFTRATDFDEPAEAAGGDFVFVLGGTTYQNTGWVKTTGDVAVIGTDPINFTQFSGAGSVTGGTNISVTGTQLSVVDAPVFAGTVDASAAGVEFSDGTQTKAGVPSVTGFVEKTASYALDTLDHQDNIVEMNMSTAGTFTIPTDAALAWPVGASMDVFASGTGEITIAGDTGVTVNSTPGLVLRTQWSSATLLKRGANSWVVYGDLKA